jgi:hypothetical protein
MAIITEQDREKAFEMFDRDASTNEVAKLLFKKNFAKAKKLREEWQVAKDGGAPLEAASGEGLADLTVQLSVDQMDRFIAGFTLQEKANAVAAVLQSRLEA